LPPKQKTSPPMQKPGSQSPRIFSRGNSSSKLLKS
jgi:hypothetical protein